MHKKMNDKKNNTWKIYMLAIISFVVGTTQFSVVGILDRISESVGVSVSVAGQLITVFALGNAIGTPILTMFITKMNQKKQLLLALGIILLGIVTTITLPGFGLLVVSRIVLGVGTGLFIVTSYSIATKLAEPERRGGAMSTVAMGFSASLVFGIPLGRMVSEVYDWKVFFLIIGVLSVVSIMIIIRTIPVLESDGVITLKEKLTVLKNPELAIIYVVTFFGFIGFSIIDTYITPYLLNVMPMMEQNISTILLVLGVGSIIGSRFGGFLSDRIGCNKTIFIAMIIQIISLFLLSVGHFGVMMTIVLLMIWEIAVWMFGPMLNLVFVTRAPEVAGIVLSLNSTFVQLGFASGSSIGGIIIKVCPIATITWISVVSTFIAVTIYAFINRNRTLIEEGEQFS